MLPLPRRSTLFPYTTLFRSYDTETGELLDADPRQNLKRIAHEFEQELGLQFLIGIEPEMMWLKKPQDGEVDRKSTRLNSSHLVISYAVFCLKKKKRQRRTL